MIVEARMSGDRRIRTDAYETEQGSIFCLAEPTQKGTLITEFAMTGEVLDQVLSDTKEAEQALAKHLTGNATLHVTEAPDYSAISVNAACSECGLTRIGREFDARAPESIGEIPVVPIFVCGSCGARYYQLGDTYLRRIVARKTELFDKAELAEMEKNEGTFVGVLQENIIRIFASKKVKRLRLGANK